MYKIMVVDDHPIVRNGLVNVIETKQNMKVVACAANGAEALKLVKDTKKNPPDLILLDILMPKMNGIEFIKTAKTVSKIVILSTEIDRYTVMNMLNLEINGYILKDEAPNNILRFIEKVLENDDYVALSNEVLAEIKKNKSKRQLNLTETQVRIMQMISSGQTNREISQELFITERTVKAYLTKIYTLLQVSNRAQAIAVAIKNELI
ncbi:response regulator transcription factor [Liquorilactobacillus satsumensis]|uniref:response regulator transcription factor n=1 Tax=Liquorilactobacillus satsumensis TaxID=259059 RepID=UPI001E5918D8|nr:response regulator transcription factor [Liquorilactobacillus satsumensis]MCC7666892.1 two-component system response regulator [Liquorilactobacillus satsumensis]MCP9312195.1 response regulator transcription factor [Liquorilactobacillus satsumensis]MCP9328673.1 response regulator transcription factor [Liquorilactobacillus satsumensis]MCP9356994.1 response regulator transcription factor [Liquorilactobacillus satsumensis]MCP9359474.1 response regulator transcription factor [Liquorilactobacillu